MLTMSIMIGNIGCGKSTLSRKLAQLQNAVVVNMDSIQQMFSGGIYGAYDTAKKAVYHDTEEAAITSALTSGLSVVVDRTNMDRKKRERFIDIGKEHAAHLVAYDWGPQSNWGKRVAAPHGVPAKTWKQVYDFMFKSYEQPTTDEGFDEIIIPPKQFRFYAFDFDGTIVTNKCPEIGDMISGTVDRMNALYEDLSNIIIIWSNRSGDLEHEMREFLLKNKVKFDFINENPIWETGSRKVFAHEYIDDRNVCLPFTEEHLGVPPCQPK